MLRTIRAFWHDQRGIALILVSVMLPAIIGFSLLAIDMSRVNNLHNDLQKGADALSLATAGELDGQSDSIVRGDRALATLVSNNYNFSTALPPGPKALAAAGVTRRYLKSIPANDSLPIAAANAITDEVADARLARYVEITVTPVGFSAIFPASFLTGNSANNGFNVSATSVAGFRTSVCDYTPVFICNPYEALPGGISLEMAANSQAYRRKQIKLRGDGFYGPGNFAFLASPDGNGANALEQSLARVKPVGCYAQDGVDTEPGQNSGPVKDGLNARFGLTSTYVNSAGPAKNVRMGIKNVVCNNGAIKSFDWETTLSQGTGLNKDSCFPNCTTLDGGRSDAGMLGDGIWNPSTYWTYAHGTSSEPTLPSELGTNPTRYEVYKYETQHPDRIADASANTETGTPACGMTPVTTVDRRILYGAIIDCNAVKAAGISLSGRQSDVPVRAFGSFFMTEPIKDGKDIYVELIDITGRGGRGTLDNFLRDEAQLYR
ncbi:pilus assembly protein TadG-related protein [Mesorhizobium sp. M0674]|uniref:pilus assembly protein TadG-related protein n=1 Tax=unclassified Mesorhizobium TaxID=325217 RepID=UPI00333DEA5E